MTADWARLPYEVLEGGWPAASSHEVPGVNRVAYDITSKPPGTIPDGNTQVERAPGPPVTGGRQGITATRPG